jgi:hypothetical protein
MLGFLCVLMGGLSTAGLFLWYGLADIMRSTINIHFRPVKDIGIDMTTTNDDVAFVETCARSLTWAEWCQPMLITAVQTYSWTVYHLHAWNAYLYDTVPMYRDAVTSLSTTMIWIKNSYYNIRTEPTNFTWCSVSILSDSKYRVLYPSLVFNESYEIININTSLTEVIQHHRTICDTAYQLVHEQSDIVEGFVVVKWNDVFLSSVVRKSSPMRRPPILVPFIPSKARFLSIEYTHPSMKAPIYMELDKRFLYVNNEVLSATFVKRWLEYQGQPYVFDKNYTLTVLDNSITMFTLTSTSYMVLEERGFHIVDCIDE